MPKPKIIPNLYFSRNTSKDVWSLTNEAAAVAANNEKNKGREMINMGQGFFSDLLLHHLPFLRLREHWMSR